MIVKEAKAIARQWVIETASKAPDFYGACYAGSANWLPDNATLPATSDLDVWVILTGPIPEKMGKFIYQDVMLEVSYMSQDQFQSPELILGDYHLAGNFRAPNIILDPSGQLAQLQAAVAKAYARRQWVYRRCEHARNKILTMLQGLKASDPFHDQVNTWLFPAGITTHVLLVAGLKNPTVRRRYMAARDLLAEYQHLDFYEALLELLGCAQMSRERVEHHLAALTKVFDLTKTMVKTPFPFTSDINDMSRSIAIDGSWELIERGYHREAIFWIAVTYSRCQKVLCHDAPPEVQASFSPGYRDLLGDLGIASFADLQQHAEQVRGFLPQVWEVAEAIIAANPGIED